MGFFFFFDKHSVGVCFAFALYRLYWGLVFSTFSASDVTIGTVGLISDSHCVFFFFFGESVGGFALLGSP